MVRRRFLAQLVRQLSCSAALTQLGMRPCEISLQLFLLWFVVFFFALALVIGLMITLLLLLLLLLPLRERLVDGQPGPAPVAPRAHVATSGFRGMSGARALLPPPDAAEGFTIADPVAVSLPVTVRLDRGEAAPTDSTRTATSPPTRTASPRARSRRPRGRPAGQPRRDDSVRRACAAASSVRLATPSLA